MFDTYSLEDRMTELQRVAAESNCEIVQADEQTLLFDLDSFEEFQEFTRRINEFRDRLKIVKVVWWYSQNGNYHAQATLYNALDVNTRIAIQAAFGSDYKKELLSVLRCLYEVPVPICLLRPKNAVAKILPPGKTIEGIL